MPEQNTLRLSTDHFICEKVLNGTIAVKFIRSVENTTYILTMTIGLEYSLDSFGSTFKIIESTFRENVFRINA